MGDMYAVLCEGNAEQAIMNVLLDADVLFFSRSEMLDEEVMKVRSAKSFERRYLNKAMPNKITVYRILDSSSENFKISKANRHKIDVVNVLTKPEIEMLIIVSEGLFDDYKRKKSSYGKPSEYVKSILGYKNVKSSAFVYDYFRNHKKLIHALHEYRRLSKISNDDQTVADLLKEK